MKCTYADLKFSLVIAVFIYNQLGDAAWVEEERGLSEEYDSNSKAVGQCSNDSCPTWYVSSANGTCRCGDSHGIISCDEYKYSVCLHSPDHLLLHWFNSTPLLCLAPLIYLSYIAVRWALSFGLWALSRRILARALFKRF